MNMKGNGRRVLAPELGKKKAVCKRLVSGKIRKGSHSKESRRCDNKISSQLAVSLMHGH